MATLRVRHPLERDAGPGLVAIVTVWTVALMILLGNGVGRPGGREASAEAAAERRRVFCELLGRAVTRIERDDLAGGRALLGRCSRLLPGEKVVQTLLDVCSWLSDRPAEQIEALIDAGRYLASRDHPMLVRAGVSRYGKRLLGDWTEERTNATHRAKGDEAYEGGAWQKAYRHYRRIADSSRFHAPTRERCRAARRKLGAQLVARAEAAERRGDRRRAARAYEEALAVAEGPERRRALAGSRRLERERRIAALTRHAGALLRAGLERECLRELARMPAGGPVPEAVVRLRAGARAAIARTEARWQYLSGNGEQALSVLRGHASLRVLREKIVRVVDLYGRAEALLGRREYDRARALWRALLAVEPDPHNWYAAQSVSKLRLDPARIATAALREAQALLSGGRRIAAARKCREALRLDPGNGGAWRLRERMIREIGLGYGALLQRWRDGHPALPDRASFRRRLRYWRDSLRLVDPGSRKLAEMGRQLAMAGER